MLVKCPAETCIFYEKGLCNAEYIEMIDFEYYSTIDKQEKEMSDDDIKCKTYKSIYSENRGNY